MVITHWDLFRTPGQWWWRWWRWRWWYPPLHQRAQKCWQRQRREKKPIWDGVSGEDHPRNQQCTGKMIIFKIQEMLECTGKNDYFWNTRNARRKEDKFKTLAAKVMLEAVLFPIEQFRGGSGEPGKNKAFKQLPKKFCHNSNIFVIESFI